MYPEVYFGVFFMKKEYMERAIALAKKGVGAVNPNPLVGCVIVKDDRIIGEGYHAKYGDLHAERNAIKNLTEPAGGAEMYVTLEPCCHTGKQPPCVEAIVEQGIKTVYVGSDDPNEKVAGKGIAYLREHGIHVETQVLKEACDALNPVFFHYITKHTPYVVMKYAMTMDGKIAAYTGNSKWISGEKSRARVQEMRNELTGIMVGVGTVLADNPLLNCRMPGGRNPVRIVCDTYLRTPLDSQLVNTAKEYRTILACGNVRHAAEEEKVKAYTEKGVEVLPLPVAGGHADMTALMQELGKRDIDGILLEGGGTLNYTMVKLDLVSEVRVFMAPKILGGKEAKSPVQGQGFASPDLAKHFTLCETEHVGEDIYLRYVKRV